MAKNCSNCGKALSFRDSFVHEGKNVCKACLNALDPSRKNIAEIGAQKITASVELTPAEQEATQKLSDTVTQQLAAGQSKESIVKGLVKQNWQEPAAVQFVNVLEQKLNELQQSPEWRREMANKNGRHMLYGILWAVGGTVITAVTYQKAASSPTGGTYFVAWGAIVFGLFDFFRGLFGWLKYKE